MDPYLILEYAGMKYKTKVASGLGKFPVWNEQFEFDIASINDEIKLTCKDENLISDDFIG
jgi:Ca2+-dependent lipid-binding protein